MANPVRGKVMVFSSAEADLSSSLYVSHIVALAQNVVAGLTDGSLVQLSAALDSSTLLYSGSLHDAKSRGSAASQSAKPGSEGEINTLSSTLVGLAALPAPQSVVSCDSQGRLQTWDLRARGAQYRVDGLDSGLVATSLGASAFGEVAIGTEARPDAEVVVYDLRQIRRSKPLVRYTNSHSDDVTELQFHPQRPGWLLSGAADGVVNLFDLGVEDEDEAVVLAFNNQASVHKLGFLGAEHVLGSAAGGAEARGPPGDDGEGKIFALSHMETLKVFGLAENAVDEEFGDLRARWNCQYVADFRHGRFLVGSNDEGWAGLIPFDASLGGRSEMIELSGGHGSDVVRCFDWSPVTGACFTGGEDGKVKLWDIGGRFEEAVALAANEGRQRVGKSRKKTLKEQQKQKQRR